ncbi:MAG: putative Ig domain-containing protein [Planctomycetales bacterium]|nr:putative Ig domain-containing protein [Planctomycetales bacterium]
MNGPRVSDPNTGKLNVVGQGGFSPPPFHDVNCDTFVSPSDVLQIVNFLNGTRPRPGWLFEQSGGSGDGAGSFANESCSPLLREGNSLITSLVSDFVVPAGASAISFEYESLSFDQTSQGSMRDAFEAALLDKSGNALVHPLSASGDSFFNITEGLSAAFSSGTTQNGNKVSLSLANVLPGSEAQLVVRLVNNDSDTESSVLIKSLQIEFATQDASGSNTAFQGGSGGGLASPTTSASTNASSSSVRPTTTQPPTGAIAGRATSKASSENSIANSATASSSGDSTGEGSAGTVIDSRGTEFWIGFPDNLFEGGNVPQKALHISGEVATTGFVEIPGLIDPSTMLPFRVEFVVNPGEVTAVELPSDDLNDSTADDQTDFDVEVELVAKVQQLGVHVVAQDPVTVYGINRAVNTTDAFLALPLDSLGTEYLNLGYGNTHRLTTNPIGSQFLIVGTEDDTQVQIDPGEYTFATASSQAKVIAPDGTSAFFMGSNTGADIGPFIGLSGGDWTVEVKAPFDGYSGDYDFELVELASAAVPKQIGEIVEVNFPTGQEAKVVSFDIAAGQQIYYDTLNQGSPSVRVWLVSPSGGIVTLSPANDTTTVTNNQFQFRETGTYYVLMTADAEAALDFKFKLIDLDTSPMWTIGERLAASDVPVGTTTAYRIEGEVGKQVLLNSLTGNRGGNLSIYGPGGTALLSNHIPDSDVLFTFPQTATYYAWFTQLTTLGPYSYDVELSDVSSFAELPTNPTTVAFSGGDHAAYQFDGVAGQTLVINIQSGQGRNDFRVYDPAGNRMTLGGGSGNVRTARLLVDGSYRVTVGGLVFADAGQVTFDMDITDDAPVSKSGLNTEQTLTIAAGQTASYQFSAPAGTPLLIDALDTASENLSIDFTAPDGSRLFTGVFGAGELQDIPQIGPDFLPQSGTYTITLRGNTSGAAGSYRFRVLDLTAATAINVGDIVSEDLIGGREAFVYSFSATAGQQLAFDGLAGSGARLRVFDRYLQRVFPTGAFDTSPTANGLARVVRDGVHYVVLIGEGNAPVNVSFRLLDLAAAPKIAVGERLTGIVSPGQGRQDYRIDLSAGQRVRLENLLSTNPSGQIRIENVGGRAVYTGSISGDSGPRSYFPVAESGEYIVSVLGSQTANVPYDFRIDDIDMAQALQLDTDLTVVLSPGRETLALQFEANAGDRIDFDNIAATAQNLNWSVFGPDSESIGGSNDARDFSITAIRTGTYYLLLSGRNVDDTTVQFRATRTPASSIALTKVNQTVELDVGIGQTLTYGFTAPVGSLLFVNVLKSDFAIRAHNVTLQTGETYLLQDQLGGLFDFNPDLTGSIISSSHPIAVYGSNRCTFMPTQFSACDHLVEQLPATNTWGREFVTVPLATGTTVGDRFRFLAQTDGTEVKIDGTVVATLNRGQFHEQVLTQAAYIQSNGPILVAQYAHSQQFYQSQTGGDPNFLGDPFMVIIPPYEQFLSSYTVSTPAEDSIPENERFDRNFINLVAPAEAVGQIELDGVALEAGLFTAIGESGFFGAQIPITLGSYSLAGPLPFGVFVYGFGSFDSYGYTGGQALSPVADVGSVLLTPATANPQVNNAIVLTARVADSFGGPIEGIRVDFDVSGVNPQRGFGFSDADGNVQFSYVGNSMGRDVVTASVGQLLDDSIIDWRTDAAAPQITVTSPLDGSSVPAGTTLVASGFAIADFPNAVIDLIMVNGTPLDSVDAAGNFFAQLFVGPGDNEYEFTAIDSNNQTTSQIITISGLQPDESSVDFTQFADVTGSFDVRYARTSYHTSGNALYAETAVENVGQFPADAPLIVAIANISDPLVLVRGAAGETPDGLPYYDFTGLVTGGTLAPQSQSGFLSAAFYNPNQTQFTYDLLFYGKLNEPPQFTSLPTTTAELQREYSYQVAAFDPNGETVSFELLAGPSSMTIDATTGLLRWTPGADDSGVHAVEVQVSDERLGMSRQRFHITARVAPANRAPVFSSFPVGLAEVGVDYPYVPQAVDADGDALSFSIVSGPSGMSIDATSGDFSWQPTAQQLGNQDIVVEVSDGRGGSARQSFSVLVISPADNLAPVIVSSPPVSVKLGSMNYQTIAHDGDGESLIYALLDGPAGMTIDSGSGLVSWTSTIADLGVHSVTIQALDTRGGVDVQSFNLAVFDNQDPTITSQPVVSAQVGNAYSYQVAVSDSVDDMLSYKLLAAPSGMTIDNATGLVSWDVTDAAYEQERVTVAVMDGRGGLATQSFTIDVTGGKSLANNVNPFFVSVAPSVATVGTKLLYDVDARDPNGDALSYDLPLAPDGMVIDPVTGQLGWLPRADQAGMQQVVIRVKDGTSSGVWLQSFQIIVDANNTAPVITSTAIASASVGNPWEYRLQAQDADGDNLMFELLSPASGVTLTALDGADASAVLSFTPGAVGSVPIAVAVRDARGGVAQQQFTVTVADTAANIAPVVHSSPRMSVAAGQPWFYLIEVDDPNGDPMGITLSGQPAGMTLDENLRAVSWLPTLDQLGGHSATLTFADGRGGVTEQTFSIEVISTNNNTAPRIVSPPSAFRATVGNQFAYDLRAADDDGDPVEWTLVEAPHGASLDRAHGILRYTPTLDQIGLQRFVISAKDPAGLEAQQSFSLLVSGANLVPIILSRAPSEAVAEERFVYGVRAVDAENDVLVYALTESPSGMTIDAQRGIIRWTPTLGQLGTHRATVRVSDSQGNSSSQTFDILVTQVVRNQPPVITSRAVFKARVDAEYRYQVTAMDPEAETITYSLVESPAGMQIDSASGLITWTPTAAQAGAHLVRVAAADTSGNVSVQRFGVQARANQAPVIASTAPTSVSLGGVYRYDLQVTDAEGDELTYQLLVGPSGMEIDSRGRIRWATAPGVELSNPVAVQVTDSFGASVMQTYTLEVTPDTTAPIVTLQLSANPLALGQDTVVVVRARDDVGVAQLELTLDGVPQVLDANNSLTLRGNVAGLYNLQATARDASGNVSTSDVQLRVFDPADTQGPTITITSPAPNQIVTTLTDIVGSVTDDNLQFYRVDYGRADLVDINKPTEADPDYKQLVRKNAAAVDEVLATFDPTMLHNDDYVIRILAQDLSGNVSAKTLTLGMDGQLKLGQFELDFTDLTIPVAGIPITVTRSYDTRDAGEVGDFGYGWTLSVSDPNIRETLPVNQFEQQGLARAATPFRDGTRVYITNPEGRRVAFTFRPQRQFSLFGGGSWSARFVPDPGVYDSLDVGQLQLRQVNGAFYHGFDGAPFNPNAYRLTTKDGTVYEYGQFGGLDNIHDRNNNRIDIRPNGVFSSSGESVEFLRDAQGRISQIVDPAGNSLTYDYDSSGNLIDFTDQAGLTRTYGYSSVHEHFLETIIDANGQQVFSAVFDGEGRLLSSANAVGATVSNEYDPLSRTQKVVDPVGNETNISYDERGNIVRAESPTGTVELQYDDRDNLTRAVDALQNEVLQTYDTNGNLTKITNPLLATYKIDNNSFGQVTGVTDPLGHQTQLVYNATGELTKFINALGEVTTATYDSRGRAMSSTDAVGLTTLFEYGGGPRATIVEFPTKTSSGSPLVGGEDPPAGPRQQFDYNALGQVRQFTDANGNVTNYVFDAIGRPLEKTDATGSKFSFSYTGDQLTVMTDPLGRTTRFEYDSQGRRIRTIDASGAIEQYVYSANNQIVEIKDKRGNSTTYTYHPDGQVETESNALQGVTRYEYNAIGQRTAVVDPGGHRWLTEYDAVGRITKVIDPLGNATVYAYDEVGNRTSSTDANGNTYRYEYDGLNRLIRQIDPLGNVFTVGYDASNNPITFTNPRGESTAFEYDAQDRMTRSTDASGASRLLEYDLVGNLIRYTNELGKETTFEYDEANRGIRSINAIGGQFTRTLDAYGNTIRTRDELGRTVNYEFDLMNRLVSVSNTNGQVTRYAYDAVGNQLSTIDPASNATEREYDALNRLTTLRDPLGNSRTYEYDLVGNLVATVDRNGRRIEFSYDAARRPSQETWLDGSTIVQTISAAYDTVGNLLELGDASGTLNFAYNSLNLPTMETRVGSMGIPSFELSYAYDSLGNVTSIVDGLGTELTRSINERNLNRSTSYSGGGVDPLRIDYSYDERGVRNGVSRYADLVGNQLVGSSTWEYDAAGRLANLTHLDSVGQILAQYDFTRDDFYRVTSVETSSGTTSYNFDDFGQLVETTSDLAPNESFEYDINGNQAGTGVVVGDNNQLLSDGIYEYEYDNEGNVTVKTHVGSGESIRFLYDHRNRLIQVEGKDQAGAVTFLGRYTYDALDRRVLVDEGGSVYSTVYFGSTPWADLDLAGNVQTRYLAGERIDELLARWRPGEGTAWYLGDHLGTVHDVVNNAGQVLNHTVYSSFGDIVSETNPTAGDRFKFTGREYDALSGMYYYRARFYDPDSRQFMNEDPLGLSAGDTNLHRFVGNDPINNRDPSGRAATSEGSGLLAFVGVYSSIALSYGKDVPFTFQIGCSGPDCGIAGSIDGSALAASGIPIGGGVKIGVGQTTDSDGNATYTWSVSGEAEFPDYIRPVKQYVPFHDQLGVSGGFSGGTDGSFAASAKSKIGPVDIGINANLAGPKAGEVSQEIELPGVPALSTEEAELPDVPFLPEDSEFEFLVKSQAKSPHLLISANVAIYVGVAQLIELIASVATAEDWVSSAEVEYEASIDNPKASVSAWGFADIPPRPIPIPPRGPDGSSNYDPNPPTPPKQSSANGNDDDDDDGDNSPPSLPPGTPYQPGNGELSALGDRVWYDDDRDGIQDTGELGVQGVTVRLYQPGLDDQIGGGDDVFIAEQITDAYGRYLFPLLAPGDYFIQWELATLPTGYEPTLRNATDDAHDSDADTFGFSHIVSVGAGEVNLTVDLGIKPRE